jgi:hypothetical protein
MPSDNDLSKELLRQNGIESGKISEQDRIKIYQLMAKDKVRLKRMKWATGISAGLLLVSFIMVLVSDALWARGHPGFDEDFLSIFSTVTFILFLWCAGSLAGKTWLAGKHRSQAIEARLAGIEEQLKRVTKNH